MAHRLSFLSVVSTVLIACTASPQEAVRFTEPGFDDSGNIFVLSDEDKPIVMAKMDHCGEASESADRQTMLCVVAADRKTEVPVSRKMEVYLHGGKKLVLDPGAPLLEWHVWNDGRQLAVHAGDGGHGKYLLYNIYTGDIVEQIPEPIAKNLLPNWAKSRAQLQDESVPESPALSEDRNNWMAKALRDIQRLQPGMTRKDVLKLFNDDGGMQFPPEGRYVYKECNVIKVNVRFKLTATSDGSLRFNPDDVIESVSKPYLEWPSAD